MLNYDAIEAWNFAPVVQTYTEHDSILYALGLSPGADPTDLGQLRYVYEKNLLKRPWLQRIAS